MKPSIPIASLVTIAILAGAVALRMWDPTPIANLRLAVFDTYLTTAPREPDPDYPVRIVTIDDASLAKLGQWPWPRSDLALIIERLTVAGAKSISLDLLLAEPDRLSPEALAQAARTRPDLTPLATALGSLPSNDEALARALSKAPAVLGLSGTAKGNTLPAPRARIATAGDDPTLFAPAFDAAIASLPRLNEAARGLGAVNWLPERDQIIRRVPLVITIGGTLYPSLSLEALRIAENDTTIFIRASGGSGVAAFGQQTGIETIRTGRTVMPTTADGQLWLHLASANPRRYISAHTLIDGTFKADDIKGRHILIGASAAGLLDLRATALDPSTPGVEIHAQALEQMLAGDHLERPAYATGAELVFLIAMSLLAAFIIKRQGPLAAAAAVVAAIVLVGALSWSAFRNAGLLFDPVYPALSLLAVYLSGSLASYMKTEADRAGVRRAFGHYVAASLVDEIAKDPAKLRLGGEMRDVTILFADVRGFSRLSEGMDAEHLIRFVNRLFTPLSEVILAHRGTIDKFMGDAVMAFWNAPVLDTAHAANACRAAIAMQHAVAELNRAAAAEAAADGRPHKPIRLGIGLNTGACCVGNVGSPQRFDYSVLGDAVNVAARFEETTKTFATPIIMGEATARAAEGFAVLPIATEGQLRGKDRTERLYALLGDEQTAKDPLFQALAVAHQSFAEARANGDTAAAREHLAKLRALEWPNLATLLDLYDKSL